MSRPALIYSRSRKRDALGELSDARLMKRLRESDELALDELVRRKIRPLVQLAYRYLGDLEESKDVVQLAFLRVWEKRSSYDPKWSPNTWIYRITSNLAIDHLRARQSRDRSNEGYRVHLRGIGGEGPRRTLSELSEDEVQRIFLELADCLTEKQRGAFVLREVEGHSSREVARMLGCRESTVRNHLFNARKTLRAELARRYPEYLPEGYGDDAS